MINLNNLTLSNFERLFSSWNGEPTERLLFISGGANMFGGHTRHVHVRIARNGSDPNPKVEVLGVATSGWNIARGANGPDSSSGRYYKGATSFDSLDNTEPTYSFEIKGYNGGADDAMCGVLGATKDFYVK